MGARRSPPGRLAGPFVVAIRSSRRRAFRTSSVGAPGSSTTAGGRLPVATMAGHWVTGSARRHYSAKPDWRPQPRDPETWAVRRSLEAGLVSTTAPSSSLKLMTMRPSGVAPATAGASANVTSADHSRSAPPPCMRHTRRASSRLRSTGGIGATVPCASGARHGRPRPAEGRSPGLPRR
jgi:hypothetical protein